VQLVIIRCSLVRDDVVFELAKFVSALDTLCWWVGGCQDIVKNELLSSSKRISSEGSQPRFLYGQYPLRSY